MVRVAPISLAEVQKRYPAFTLGSITSTIDIGVTALLGANGAGKTTLLRLMNGALATDAGSI